MPKSVIPSGAKHRKISKEKNRKNLAVRRVARGVVMGAIAPSIPKIAQKDIQVNQAFDV